MCSRSGPPLPSRIFFYFISLSIYLKALWEEKSKAWVHPWMSMLPLSLSPFRPHLCDGGGFIVPVLLMGRLRHQKVGLRQWWVQDVPTRASG